MALSLSVLMEPGAPTAQIRRWIQRHYFILRWFPGRKQGSRNYRIRRLFVGHLDGHRVFFSWLFLPRGRSQLGRSPLFGWFLWFWSHKPPVPRGAINLFCLGWLSCGCFAPHCHEGPLGPCCGGPFIGSEQDGPKTFSAVGNTGFGAGGKGLHVDWRVGSVLGFLAGGSGTTWGLLEVSRMGGGAQPLSAETVNGSGNVEPKVCDISFCFAGIGAVTLGRRAKGEGKTVSSPTIP